MGKLIFILKSIQKFRYVSPKNIFLSYKLFFFGEISKFSDRFQNENQFAQKCLFYVRFFVSAWLFSSICNLYLKFYLWRSKFDAWTLCSIYLPRYLRDKLRKVNFQMDISEWNLSQNFPGVFPAGKTTDFWIIFQHIKEWMGNCVFELKLCSFTIQSHFPKIFVECHVFDFSNVGHYSQ